MFWLGTFGIIDSCIPCCAGCSGGEIAFLILAWFSESLISAGEIPSFCSCVVISASEMFCFFKFITLSSVVMLTIQGARVPRMYPPLN